MELIRIERRALPYDHVARQFDYSPERIEALIEEGYAAAQRCLAEARTACAQESVQAQVFDIPHGQRRRDRAAGETG